MPSYGFICEDCNHSFDKFLLVDDRNNPLNEACPKCGKHTVKKDYGQMRQALSSDHNLTPNSATGGRWNELMSRMKKGLPKRHHANLDSASGRTGKRWLG